MTDTKSVVLDPPQYDPLQTVSAFLVASKGKKHWVTDDENLERAVHKLHEAHHFRSNFGTVKRRKEAPFITHPQPQ